jgi:D-3-phosphoglycerate dehydrogenase
MKILISDPISPRGIEILKGFEVQERGDRDLKVEDFDGVIVRSATKVTGEVIARGKKLRVIGRTGLDDIDLEGAKKRGIEVVNTLLVISPLVLALAMILAICRNLVRGIITIELLSTSDMISIHLPLTDVTAIWSRIGSLRR